MSFHNKKFNIAVLGASGNVGREILNILSSSLIKFDNVYALASERSVGKSVSFGEEKLLQIFPVDNFDFNKIDLLFNATGNDVAAKFLPKALESGASVIDKSSLYRMQDGVPLIVPEVNGQLITSGTKLVASPNCCVIPLVVALSPLHNAAKVKRIVMSTYQSVSGAGKNAMDELYNQTKGAFMYEERGQKYFERQIAFNVIPKIDDWAYGGITLEEKKIFDETVKILGTLEMSVTAVRVPVFIGHSMSVNVEFHNSIDAQEAVEILEESESINVINQNSELKYITPAEVVGEDTVYVSRVRNDSSVKNALNMWIVCDNLRKGAATNAVQIAEKLLYV